MDSSQDIEKGTLFITFCLEIEVSWISWWTETQIFSITYLISGKSLPFYETGLTINGAQRT